MSNTIASLSFVESRLFLKETDTLRDNLLCTSLFLDASKEL